MNDLDVMRSKKYYITYEGNIEYPCFGTLKEIHAALIGPLNRLDSLCTINGFAYIIRKEGFESNTSHKIYSCDVLQEMPPDGLGTCILMEYEYLSEIDDHETSVEIISMSKIPHVSKRCKICGCQLDQYEIKKTVCESCYGESIQ